MKKYKDVTLDQRCMVEINDVWYWLLYDHQKDDYLLINSKPDTKYEFETLRKSAAHCIALINDFDENLNHGLFGQITRIRTYGTGYNCLCALQNKSSYSYSTTTVKIQPVKKIVTREDIEAHFGKNINIML